MTMFLSLLTGIAVLALIVYLLRDLFTDPEE